MKQFSNLRNRKKKSKSNMVNLWSFSYSKNCLNWNNTDFLKTKPKKTVPDKKTGV